MNHPDIFTDAIKLMSPPEPRIFLVAQAPLRESERRSTGATNARNLTVNYRTELAFQSVLSHLELAIYTDDPFTREAMRDIAYCQSSALFIAATGGNPKRLD